MPTSPYRFGDLVLVQGRVRESFSQYSYVDFGTTTTIMVDNSQIKKRIKRPIQEGDAVQYGRKADPIFGEVLAVAYESGWAWVTFKEDAPPLTISLDQLTPVEE